MTDPLEPDIGHLWQIARGLRLRSGPPERLYGLVGDPLLPWNQPNRSPFDSNYTSGNGRTYFVPGYPPINWNELIAPRTTRLLRAARRQWWRTQDAWHVLIGTDTVCDDG